MFPALPPAPKPQSSIFGYGSGMVRRDGLGGSGKAPSASPWGAGGSNGGSGAASEAEGPDEGEAGKGKKKGNKGKKQVLMNWG